MSIQRRVVWALPAVLSWGCQGPPSTHARPDFSWTAIFEGLDESPLSACANNDVRLVVGATASGDAFVVEQSLAEPDAWNAPLLPAGAHRLWWCAANAEGEIVAVGEEQTILRRSVDGTWNSEHVADTEASRFYGVWPRGEEWFIVGGSEFLPDQGGVILRSSGGSEWLAEPIPSDSATLFKIWGDDDSLWAVGHGGTILREDDGLWELEPHLTEEPLVGVWGTGDGSAYAVGGANQGVVLHHDGGAWSVFAEVSEPLAGVWTGPSEALYVAGCYGFLSRYDALEVGRDPLSFDVTYADQSLCLHAMQGDSEQLLVVGADLYSGAISGWRGAVLGRGDVGAGSITYAPIPDAGPLPDSGPIADADAAPGRGPGEYCVDDPNGCAEGLRCWGSEGPDGPTGICAADCKSASECTPSLGPDACCELPGVQSHTPVCLPGDFVACTGA